MEDNETEDEREVPVPVPTLSTGGSVASIIPRNVDETFRLAKIVCIAGMAPRGLESPEKVMIAIMAGAELGLPPMQSIQSIAVIGNRPSLYGDGLLAVVRRSKACVYVKEWIEGEGDDMVAYCETMRRGESEPVRKEFSVADAKAAGLWKSTVPWNKYPKRMLGMRARAWCLRDTYADITKGFGVLEEVRDFENMKDITPSPKVSGIASRLNANSKKITGFSEQNVENALSGKSVPLDSEKEIVSTSTTDATESDQTSIENAGQSVASASSITVEDTNQPASEETPKPDEDDVVDAEVIEEENVQEAQVIDKVKASITDFPISDASILKIYSTYLYDFPTSDALDAGDRKFWEQYGGERKKPPKTALKAAEKIYNAHETRVKRNLPKEAVQKSIEPILAGVTT